MRRFLMPVISLFASSLMAEQVGNMEYKLPEIQENWKIANEFHGNAKRKSSTVIYIPESDTSENMQEFFAVHVSNLPSENLDEESLKKPFDVLFPGQEIEMTILEKDASSAMYAWAAKEEFFKGLGRVFTNENGTSMISWQAENADIFEAHREVVVKALKEAKIVNNK